MAEEQSKETTRVSPNVTRRPLSRRRLLQLAGGGIAAAAGAAALYEGLARVAPPNRHSVEPPSGGYPVGQYQVADYGVRVQPDAKTAVVIAIPPVWNLVITATLTLAPGLREQQRLEAALRAI